MRLGLGRARPSAMGPRRRASTTRSAPIALVFWLAVLLLLFCVQSFNSFENFVRAHGVERLQGRVSFLSSLTVASLLLIALPGNGVLDRQQGDDVEWLSTLPAPAWVLHAAKLAEAALLNPLGWMLLFPFFTGLGLHCGLGLLAPLVALGVCLPILLCCALLGSVVDFAQLALSQSRAFRVLRVLGPVLGMFVFVASLGASGLQVLNLDVWSWLDTLPEPSWLPFAEPARAMLAWQRAPLGALAKLGLFSAEMAVLLSVGTFALHKLYRADLVLGRARSAVRGAAPARARAARHRSFAGPLGAVVTKELLWLRRNPWNSAGLVFNIVLLSGIALLLVSRGSRLSAASLPGLASFGVGVLLLFSLAFWLEQERPALGHWGALPRSLSWVFAQKTLLMTGLALLGALPTAVYASLSLPRFAEAVPAFLYGAAGLLTVAFLQTALWFSRLSLDAPTSLLRHFGRTAQLALFAAWWGELGFASPLTLAVVPALVFSVAFVSTFWTTSLARVSFVLDSSALEPTSLTPAYALVTILVLRIVQAGSMADGAQRGMSPSLAATVAILFAVVAVLPASLLWLRYKRGVTGLCERLGLARGKGLRVILREGVLWSLPAIAVNLAYWPLFGQRVAESTQQVSQQPALMPMLAGSPLTLVAIGCITVPIVEELLYRGMLYRSLRSGYGSAVSLLSSTVLFTLDHPLMAAVPVFCASVCMTLALERSRSLYAALLVHMLYNGVAAWSLL
jgi:membrane protease YdiL (CAAX protease family)